MSARLLVRSGSKRRRTTRWQTPLLLALVSVACGGAAEPKRQPDVFLILCDTLRADAILDPEQRYDTPNLDALAQQGVAFSQAFSHAPMTLPAHTALFSSRPPLETGVWNNGEEVPAGLPLLAEWMRDQGYETRAVISLGTLNLGGRSGLSRGFEHYDLDFWRMARGDQVAARVTRSLAESSAENSTGRSTAKPLFFFAHYCDPHEPYDAHGLEKRQAQVSLDGKPLATLSTADMTQWFQTLELGPGRHEFVIHSQQPFRLRWFEVKEGGNDLAVTWTQGKRLETLKTAKLVVERKSTEPAACDVKLWINDHPNEAERSARYAREVHYVDGCIGQLLAELRAAGRYEDALILFTSDHGESLGERGHWGHAQGLDDAQIHVPLIIKLPRGDARRARLVAASTHLTPQVDLAPTILEIAGLPALPGARGASLFAERSSVLITETHRPESERDQIALRDQSFKMVYLPLEQRFTLYDLEHDPGETQDVFAERKAERSQWPARLEALARAGVERKQGGGAVDAATQDDLEALGYGGQK